MNNSNFTYLKSGVDIEKTTNLVKFISKLSKSTRIEGSEIKNFNFTSFYFGRFSKLSKSTKIKGSEIKVLNLFPNCQNRPELKVVKLKTLKI